MHLVKQNLIQTQEELIKEKTKKDGLSFVKTFKDKNSMKLSIK